MQTLKAVLLVLICGSAHADNCISPIENVLEVKTTSGTKPVHQTFVGWVPGCGLELSAPVNDALIETDGPKTRAIPKTKPEARKRGRKLPCKKGRTRKNGICGRWN